MRCLGIIPARHASSRFPAKMLADLNGKTLLQRVYERVRTADTLDDLLIATDHPIIYQHATEIGAKVVMTSPRHESGTERCAEAAAPLKDQFDVVINIQGDEPFITNEQLRTLAESFNSPGVEIATLYMPFADAEQLHSPNTAKLVTDKTGKVLYFSRAVIPAQRDKASAPQPADYKQHIGLYAYRTDTLLEIAELPGGFAEQVERLEQLRWLEHGYRIFAFETQHSGLSVDTPEDLERAKARLRDEFTGSL